MLSEYKRISFFTQHCQVYFQVLWFRLCQNTIYTSAEEFTGEMSWHCTSQALAGFVLICQEFAASYESLLCTSLKYQWIFLPIVWLAKEGFTSFFNHLWFIHFLLEMCLLTSLVPWLRQSGDPWVNQGSLTCHMAQNRHHPEAQRNPRKKAHVTEKGALGTCW